MSGERERKNGVELKDGVGVERVRQLEKLQERDEVGEEERINYYQIVGVVKEETKPGRIISYQNHLTLSSYLCSIVTGITKQRDKV